MRRSAGLALILLIAGSSLLQWRQARHLAEQRLGFAISIASQGLLVE